MRVWGKNHKLHLNNLPLEHELNQNRNSKNKAHIRLCVNILKGNLRSILESICFNSYLHYSCGSRYARCRGDDCK